MRAFGWESLNVSKAVSFVEERGTALERYTLNFFLGKERNDEIPLRHLRMLQQENGGFPYNDEEGKASCVNAASNNLSLMLELGLERSDVCRKAVEYLFRVQGEDGSWSENEAIKRYDPPFWDSPNDLRTTLWLTANITNLLVQMGYKNSPSVRKAVGFLLKNRDNEGKFGGFLHTTWISVGVFGQLEGSDSDVVKNALKVIERNFERLKDAAGDLAWCLECFCVARISKENPLVKKCIEGLVNMQQEDGTWKSGDGKEFAVSTTINVLRILKRYEVW